MVQSSRGWDEAPSLAGGQTICTFQGERGEICSRSPPGAAIGHGCGASSPCRFPARGLPCDPRAARTGRPRRTSPPCLRWAGPGRQLGALRAPAAAVGRALGVRRAVSAGRRGAAGSVDRAPCFVSGGCAAVPPGRWCPQDPARPRSDGVGGWRGVGRGGRCPRWQARAEVHVRSGSSPRPGSRLVIPADRLLSLSTFEPAAPCNRPSTK